MNPDLLISRQRDDHRTVPLSRCVVSYMSKFGHAAHASKQGYEGGILAFDVEPEPLVRLQLVC